MSMKSNTFLSYLNECGFHIALLNEITSTWQNEKNKPDYADDYKKQLDQLRTKLNERL